jgi:hypothetical protein
MLLAMSNKERPPRAKPGPRRSKASSTTASSSSVANSASAGKIDTQDMQSFHRALDQLKPYQDQYPGKWTMSHSIVSFHTANEQKDKHMQWFYRADVQQRYFVKVLADPSNEVEEYFILCRSYRSAVIEEYR